MLLMWLRRAGNGEFKKKPLFVVQYFFILHQILYSSIDRVGGCGEVCSQKLSTHGVERGFSLTSTSQRSSPQGVLPFLFCKPKYHYWLWGALGGTKSTSFPHPSHTQDVYERIVDSSKSSLCEVSPKSSTHFIAKCGERSRAFYCY